MNISCRKCTPEDLYQLVEISKTTFVSSFEEHNNPDDFNTYITAAFNDKKILEELLNVNSSFYFAYIDEDLIGYFKLNEKDAQNEQFEAESIELERIYIRKAFQNKGLGKQLLQEVIALVRPKNIDFLWLGVWEHNQDAIRFYERYNFIKFGTHPYYLGNDKQTDWMLKLELNKNL